jgi:hypothetical protein
MAPSFSGLISTFSSERFDGTKLLIRASLTVSGIPITPIALPGIVIWRVAGGSAVTGPRDSLGLDTSKQEFIQEHTVLNVWHVLDRTFGPLNPLS